MSNKTIRNLRLTAGATALCLVATALTALAANYPPWWSYRGVVNTQSATNDFAAANAGQLKWFANKAKTEFDTLLPGGAGVGVNAMVASFSSSNNYNAINIGQLKNVAAPFYNRLAELAALYPSITNAYPAGMTPPYPWTAAATDDNDFAAVNIGQLKRVFSFDLSNIAFNESPFPFFVASPTNGIAPLGVSFDASTSADPDGNIANYSWAFGDNTSTNGASLPYILHSYAVPGIYTCRLTVTDNQNATGVFTRVIVVLDPLGDQDADGLPNGWESTHGLDPYDPSDAQLDADTDGLSNMDEYLNATDPLNPDSDNDSLPDGYELSVTDTHPLLFDTDLDDISDGAELINEPMSELTGPDSPRVYAASFDCDAAALVPIDPTPEFGSVVAVTTPSTWHDVAAIACGSQNTVYFFYCETGQGCGMRDPGAWIPECLPVSGPPSFGQSLAIGEDSFGRCYTLVGAPAGDEVYRYSRGWTGEWSLKNVLSGSPFPSFGKSVAMAQDCVVVGADDFVFVYLNDYAEQLSLQSVLPSPANLGTSLDIAQNAELIAAGNPDERQVMVFRGGYPYSAWIPDIAIQTPTPGAGSFGSTVSICSYMNELYQPCYDLYVGDPELGKIYRYTSLAGSPDWGQPTMVAQGAAGLGEVISRRYDTTYSYEGDPSSVFVCEPPIGGTPGAVTLKTSVTPPLPSKTLLKPSDVSSAFGAALAVGRNRFLVGDPTKGTVHAYALEGWFRGDLNQQHEWEANSAGMCIVQSDVIHAGSGIGEDGALEILPSGNLPQAAIRRKFWHYGLDTIDGFMVDYYTKPVLRQTDDLPANNWQPAPFYFNADGYPVIAGQVVTDCRPVTASAWVRVTMVDSGNPDLDGLYLNGIRIPSSISLISYSYHEIYPGQWVFGPYAAYVAFHGSKRQSVYIDTLRVVTRYTGETWDFPTDFLNDADHDGMADDWEIRWFGSVGAGNPTADNDRDGIRNLVEYRRNSCPTAKDTDGDGCSDSAEINTYGTDPASSASRPVPTTVTIIYTGPQVGVFHVLAAQNAEDWSSPFADCNVEPNCTLLLGSGRTFWIKGWIDANANNVRDGWEPTGVCAANPLTPSIGGPNSAAVTCTDPNTDGDNLPDWWEMQHFGNLTGGDTADHDSDGTSDLVEFQNGLDPSDNSSLVVSLSGTLTATDGQSGPIRIMATTKEGDWTSPYSTELSTPGAFVISGVPAPGNYWIKVYRDVDGNGTCDYWEPTGMRSEGLLTVSSPVTGINITLAETDIDHDGLPDSWERQIVDADPNDLLTSVIQVLPGADFDGDGASNADEYRCGTSPIDIQQTPRALRFTNAEQTTPGIASTVSIQLQLTSAASAPVAGLVQHVGGSATPGSDFTFSSTPVSFDTGQTLANVQITIHANTTGEPTEDILLGVTLVSGPAVSGTPSIHRLSILGDTTDSDGDGLPDWWETKYFGNPTVAVPTADPDGDGWNNAQEFANGTDPTVGSIPDTDDVIKLRVTTPTK